MPGETTKGADRRRETAQRPERATAEGLYLYGLTRSSSRSSAAGEGDGVVRVRYRDLEALVKPVPFALPRLDDDLVREHHRFVEAAMRRGTILPVPFGMVFRGRRAVVRFLEDQYIVLDEGLAFIDGYWELRVHIGGDEKSAALEELATHLYSELRRFARAAIPLEAREGRVMSAAFLVERSAWIEFVERSDDLGLSHPELTVDVTGPWPPYDFVDIQS